MVWTVEQKRNYNKAYYHDNKERYKQYRIAHKEFYNEYDRKRHHTHYKRFTRYGITLDDAIIIFIHQQKKCAICKRDDLTLEELHIDHCHSTGVVRGLLCIACNTKLGWYEKQTQHIKEYMNE